MNDDEITCKPGPKVVEIGLPNLNDIPKMMEAVANDIRSGKFGNIVSGTAVILDGDGEPTVFGWGRTDDVHSIGMLQIGSVWLSTRKAARR